MIRKEQEYKLDIREDMRGGSGAIKIQHIWNPQEDLNANNRLFAKMSIDPGNSIGLHKHDNEEEVFVILDGKAEVDDNGEKKILEKGDSILTKGGESHSIKSIGEEPLVLIAVISCY